MENVLPVYSDNTLLFTSYEVHVTVPEASDAVNVVLSVSGLTVIVSVSL